MAHHAGPLRVLVLTPLGSGGMGGIDRIMDAVAQRLAAAPPDDLSVTFAATRGKGHVALSPFRVLSVIGRATGRLVGRGPDVVHVNLSSHGSALRKLTVARCLHLLRIPYVIHLHGSGFRAYWDGARPLLSAEIRRMFERAACTIVLGRAWRDYVLGRVPDISARLRVLPNATPAPPDRQAADTPVPTILFLGHVGPRKGVPQLVEALSNLRDRPGWRAVIAGNGEVARYRDELARQGLSDRVTMPGWVGPTEVEALLASSDLLVLPSFEENLPMSVIEGMASGLAVIATPVGATEDIISDGETGLLVPPGDATALTAAIVNLLDDPALRLRLGASAKAHHRMHLEINAYVDHLTAIWRSVA